MRTNIDIDDAVLAAAMQSGAYKTKKEVVEAGLRLVARQAAYREILRWEGKLHWDGDDFSAEPPAAALHTGAGAPATAQLQEPRPPRAADAMLVVDSGVWIDFFNGAPSAARSTLRQLLARGETEIIVPDLVLYEVLRGFRDERQYLQAQQLLQALTVEATGGQALALRAAAHYRSLRAAGITVRSAIDVLLAAFCIERGYTLLHADRDFDAFASLRGLQAWRH